MPSKLPAFLGPLGPKEVGEGPRGPFHRFQKPMWTFQPVRVHPPRKAILI